MIDSLIDIEMMADNLVSAIQFLVDSVFDYIINSDSITDYMVLWYRKADILTEH